MASAVSTKKHSTLVLAVVVSLLAMLGLVVLPAQTASASVTPGTVSPSSGSGAGGTSTTLTLATNGGMASSSDGVVFLGVDKNLYRVSDGAQLTVSGGMSFVSASGFVARDGTWHIMGIGTDGNAYIAVGTTTLTKVSLSSGASALATYSGMAILGSDNKLYWDSGGNPIPGGSFASASTTISAQNSYLINAIGTDGYAYWKGGSSSISNSVTSVKAASVGSALTVLGVDGNIYRSSDGLKLTASTTFSSSSGFITGSDQWVMAGLGTDGYAYITAGGGTALNQVTLQGGGKAKAVVNGVAAWGTDNNVYRLSDGKQITGPTGVTFSSPSGWIDSNGLVTIAAVGSDGNAYVASSNSTTFSVLATAGSPKTFTSATFGGTAARSVKQTGQFTVTATAPPHAAGTVDVVLTASDSTTVTYPGSFSYTALGTLTAGTVSPAAGAGVGGLTTTMTLASNPATETMLSSSNGLVFLGAGSNIYRTTDGAKLTVPGGMTFKSASAMIDRSGKLHVTAIGVDGNAYNTSTGSTTLGKITLPGGVYAAATYNAMVILGTDQKLYFADSGAALQGGYGQYSAAAASMASSGQFQIQGLGNDGYAYWYYTGSSFDNKYPAGVTAKSVGGGVSVLGTDGNVYRAYDGTKLSVSGGAMTFTSVSGFVYSNGQWSQSAIGADKNAYVTAAGGTTLSKVTLSQSSVTAVALADGVAVLGSDNNVYRLSDGKLITGPAGVTFSSPSGYMDNSGTAHIVAVGSDGNAYVASNTTASFSLLATPVSPKVFTSATFGGTAATNVVQVDQFTVTATTPPHAAGTVDVVLTASDSTTLAFTGAFTYSGFGITSPTAGQTMPWTPTITGFGLPGAAVAVTALGVGAVCSAVVDSSGAWSCAPAVAFPQQGSFALKATQTGGGSSSTSTVSAVTAIPATTLLPAVGPRSGGTAITVQLGANGGQRSTFDGGVFVGLDGMLRLDDAAHTTFSPPAAGVSFTSASTFAASARYVAAIGSDGKAYYSNGTSTLSAVPLPTGVTGVTTVSGVFALGSDGNIYLANSAGTLITTPGGVPFAQVSGFKWSGGNYVAAVGSDGNLYYNNGGSALAKQALPSTVTALALSGTAVVGSDHLVYQANAGAIAGPNGVTFKAASGDLDQSNGTWVTAAISSDNKAYYTYGTGTFSQVTLAGGVTPVATYGGAVFVGTDGRAYRANDGSLIAGIPNGVSLTSISASLGLSGSYVAAIGSDGIAYSAVAGATSFSALTLSNTPKTYTSVSTGGTAATGVSQSGLTSSVSVSATTYSHAPGLVNVVLTASDGSTLTLPNSFTFVDFTITSPTSNQFVSRYPTITGVGLPGASVAVSVASLGTLCSTVVDSGGAWSCTSTVQLPSYGGFTLSAVQTGGGFDASASVPIFVAVAWGFAITSPTAGQTIPWSPTVTGTGYPGTNVAVTALGIGALCSAVVDSGGAWSCVSSVTFPQQGSFTLTAIQTGAASPVSAAVSVVTSIPAATLSPAVGPRSGGTSITVQLGANGGQRSTFDGEGYVGLDGVLRLNDTSHMTLSAPAGVSFTNASSFANSNRYVAAIGSDGKAYYNSATTTLSAVGLPTGVTGVTTTAGSWVLGSDGSIYSASTAAAVTGATGVTFTQISGFKYNGSTYLGAIASDGSLYYGSSGSVTKVGTVTVSAISGSVALGTDGLVYTINGPKVSSTNGVTFKAASGDLDQSNGNWVTAAISSDNKAYYTSGGTLTQVTLAGGVTPVATYGGAVFVGTDGRAYRANDGSLITGIPNGVSLSSISASLGLSGAYVAAIGSDGVAYFAGPGNTPFASVALSNTPKTYTSVSTGGTAATGVSQSGLTSSVSVSATTYSHAPGLVNVVLTASDGSTLTLPNSFTFVDFTITSPTSNQFVSRYPTITGVGLPGASVAVSVASLGTLCSTVVDSGGAWSCTSTVQLPSYGTFTLNAAQTGIGSPASASVSVLVAGAWSFAITSPTSGQTIAWSPTVTGTGYPGASVAVTALGIGSVCNAVVDSSGAWSCASGITFPQQGSFTLTAVQTGAGSPVSAAVSVVTSIPATTLSPVVGPRSGGTAITVQLGANGGQRSTSDGLLFVGLDGVVRQSSAATLTSPAGVSFVTAGSNAYGGHFDVSALGSDGKAYWASTTAAFAAVSLAAGVTPVATASAIVLLGSDGKLYWADGSGLLGGQTGVTFTQVSAYRAQSTGYAYISAIGSDNSLYYNNGTTTMSKWSSLPTTVTPTVLSGTAVLGSDGLVYRSPDAALISGPNGVTFSSVSGYTDSNGYRQIAAIGSDGNAYFNSGTTTFSKIALPGGVLPAATSGGLVVVSKSGQVYLTVDGSQVGGPAGVSYTSVSSGFGQNGRYITAVGSDGIAYYAAPGTSTFVAVALSNTPKSYTAVSTGGTAATNVSQSGLTSAVTVSATTPSHSAGTVGVVLTASDGSTLTLPNAFTFADFAISSPTPNQYVTRYPTITGIGMPGTSVAVSVTSVGTLCSTTVDSGGAWSCTSALQLPQHGTFTLNAAQTGIGNPASASVSVVVNVDWTVSTSAMVGGAAVANGALVAPGSTITYQVNYVSSAGIAMAGVTSTDDLTGVLDDATFVAGSAQLVVNGSAAVAVSDPSANVLTVPAFSLPAGKTAVLTYQVTVNANRWGAVLSRTVTATSTTEPPLSCGAACSTSEQTAVPLQVQKVGEDSSANVVPMTGSQWAVYSSANATTPVVGPIPAGSDVGLFRSTALPAGTYWLEESTSLSGFSLLAQRVQFTLNQDLSITVVSAPSNVTVTTVNGSATIRVMDVPRMALPQAGGPGTLIFYLAGFALLAVAVVAVVVAALVRRLRSSERIRKVIS